VTHNLSEGKNHNCRPHARGSVRRASGFVLTRKAEAIQKRDLEETNRDLPEADFSFTVERHGFDACKARARATDVHRSPDMPGARPGHN